MVHLRIIRAKDIKGMQQTPNGWDIEKKSGIRSSKIVSVGKLRGDRLFFRKLLYDSKRLETEEKEFRAKRPFLNSDEILVASSEVQGLKRNLAADYGTKADIARNCIEQSHTWGFTIAMTGYGLLLATLITQKSDNPELRTLLPGIIPIAVGAVWSYAAFFWHSKIDAMLHGIGVERGPLIAIESPLDIPLIDFHKKDR